MRVGHGYDVHAFGPGEHVTLGGVRIASDQGVVAHSDGDVLIHALCDALLGAAGLGDIGQWFPDSDSAHAGQDSRIFLAQVMQEIEAQGWSVANMDATLIAEAPKLAAHVPAMRETLAAALRVAIEQVNIKATTHEGLGALGRAEGLAAHVVVLLETRS